MAVHATLGGLVRRLLPVALALSTVLLAATPAAGSASGRDAAAVEQAAVRLATASQAVPVRDGAPTDRTRPCPAGQLTVSWTPPAGAFKVGGYIAPLGPPPGPATTAVNGVVLCRGSTYAYMGFEALRTGQGWQVVQVPAVEAEPLVAQARAPGAGTQATATVQALPGAGTGPLDRLAPYEPQTACDPTAKPGVVGFRDLVLGTYPATSDFGITRDCSIGGRSEHKEGRAWDWGVSVYDGADHAAAHAVAAWLFAKDARGRPYAMARRLGVMYIIFNRQIWGSYAAKQGWRPYVGPSPHTDHMHFSFSRAGALKQTSYWDGTPVRY